MRNTILENAMFISVHLNFSRETANDKFWNVISKAGFFAYQQSDRNHLFIYRFMKP